MDNWSKAVTHLEGMALCLAIGVLCLSACGSVPTEPAMLTSWVGASQTELQKAWGQPMGKALGKKGDQMLLFEVPRADAPPGSVPSGVAQPRLTPTLCRALFTVSPLGMVTGVKGVGDGCADQ